MTKFVPAETPSTTDSSTDNSSLLAPPATTASDGTNRDNKRHKYHTLRSRTSTQQLTV
jgi:hypothetical protein